MKNLYRKMSVGVKEGEGQEEKIKYQGKLQNESFLKIN